MPVLDVTVPTADGACAATLHLPGTAGPHPGVILYPDAGGVREALSDMAENLAGLGYAVLLPDVYYRVGGFAPFSMDTVFSDPGERARLMGLVQGLTAEMSVRDAGAFLDFLDGRDEVAHGPAGTTGYCMGGRISLTVAGHHGTRIGAAASFHGGRLAPEEDPDSPHLVADGVRATVLVAAAENDGSFPPDQADRLAKAYTDAGVTFTLETYPAAHGFAVPDNPTFDAAVAERHWQALADLYAAAL